MNRISASKLWQISQVLDVPVQWFFKEFGAEERARQAERFVSYETRDTRTRAKLCKAAPADVQRKFLSLVKALQKPQLTNLDF